MLSNQVKEEKRVAKILGVDFLIKKRIKPKVFVSSGIKKELIMSMNVFKGNWHYFF